MSELKAKLHELLKLPSNKQKLVLNGAALANTKTLAFYNMTSDSKVCMSVYVCVWRWVCASSSLPCCFSLWFC